MRGINDDLVLSPGPTAVVLRHPIAAASFLLGRRNAMHRALILDAAQFLFGSGELKEWRNALLEIDRGEVPGPKIANEKALAGNGLSSTLGKWLYCIVRLRKPAVVVETGVSSGLSSTVILAALSRNEHGMLYSIDLPNHDTNSDYNIGVRPAGWRIPDNLRGRWNLRLGSAKILLPELLSELGAFDMFFHDSDHSAAHMTFEFETALGSLRPGGIIVSDDINKNESFQTFVRQRRLRSVCFNKGGCAAVPI